MGNGPVYVRGMPSRDTLPDGWAAEDEDLDVILIILRAALRWKQNDLARAAGIGNSSISDYERRKKLPGRKNLRKILAAMHYRDGSVQYVTEFLRDLRTRYRVAEGGEPYPLPGGSDEVAEGGAGAPPPRAGSELRSWADQVSLEIGRAAEHFARLSLELQMARSKPDEEPGGPAPQGEREDREGR
jgi:transcriptional regulator with XRE-family HTH domain